jgi:hypothetical protein
MAGLPWIPLETRFPTGEHAIALGVALQNPMAWAHVVRLWAWAASNRADGRFEGPAAVATIETAAGWSGSPGAFAEAMSLRHIGLLDVTERGFYIHNWHIHCGAHIEKRVKDRVRKRNGKSKGTPRKLRGTSVEEFGNSAQERERERETDTTTHTQGAVDFRKAGAEAAAAVVSPGPAPLADSVLKILRAYGKNAMHASPEARASVESAIYGATPEIAASRIAAAWNPAKPWLTFYLEAITGQTKTKATRKGMAPPSTDFTSPEATTL